MFTFGDVLAHKKERLMSPQPDKRPDWWLPTQGQTFHSTGEEPEEYEVICWSDCKMIYTCPMECFSRFEATVEQVRANFDSGRWAHGPVPW